MAVSPRPKSQLGTVFGTSCLPPQLTQLGCCYYRAHASPLWRQVAHSVRLFGLTNAFSPFVLMHLVICTAPCREPLQRPLASAPSNRSKAVSVRSLGSSQSMIKTLLSGLGRIHIRRRHRLPHLQPPPKRIEPLEQLGPGLPPMDLTTLSPPTAGVSSASSQLVSHPLPS